MDAVRQALELYLKFHQRFLPEEAKNKLTNDIQRFISIALREATLDDLFTNITVCESLRLALKQKAAENSDVMPMAKAFLNLEKYFCLLVEQPWKSEFREIKMYGGFYRTKVKSALPDCEHIFEQAGYLVFPERCTMIFQEPVVKNSLLHLAFDCKVGHMLCLYIAEHCRKVKGLSMTLTDVISNILREGRSRNKSILRHGSHLRNVLTPSISAPPAIPKREPALNTSALRGNVVSECGLSLTSRTLEPGLVDKILKNDVTPPESSDHSANNSSSYLANPPQISSHVITAASLAYIDSHAEEILPELPQGTCDEHILETLKLVNLQDTHRQLALKDGKQDIRFASTSDHSQVSTSVPFLVRESNSGATVMHGTRIDEGIDLDLPTSKPFSLGTKYSFMGNKQVISNNQSINHPHLSYDQGYSESIYSQPSSNLSQDSQQTIYHPPNITSDSAGYIVNSKPLLSRQNALSPYAPSRALKNKEKASSCSKMFVSAPHVIGKNHMQNEAVINHPSFSAPGFFDYSQSFDIEQSLHREQPAVCKSSSLQTTVTSKPLPKHITLSRMTQRDDRLHWMCPACFTLNLASNKMCSTCSHNCLESDVRSTVKADTVC